MYASFVKSLQLDVSPSASVVSGGHSTHLCCLFPCSVLFNFLGRDFFNALSEKDAERFTEMLFKWLGGVVLGVPVFVFRDYLQARSLP